MHQNLTGVPYYGELVDLLYQTYQLLVDNDVQDSAVFQLESLFKQFWPELLFKS